MIKEVDWGKFARFLPSSGETACNICGKTIVKDDEGITYSKARSGSRLFMHIKCVRMMEGRNGRKETH